jgi:hypothetical protein
MNKKVLLFKEVNPQTIRNRPDPSIKGIELNRLGGERHVQYGS